jgi:periplasmic protein TonB
LETLNTNALEQMTALSIWRRWGGWILGLCLAVLLLALMWYLLSDTVGTKRPATTVAMLMLPPPPPPPEPEKQQEPEPEKVEQKITPVEPAPVESVEKPMDDETPSPSKDLGDPVTMNAEAQAGDGGIAVGRGGGMIGGGGGRGGGDLASASYQRYISSVLQRALLANSRTRNLAFSDLRIDLWLAADGKTTRVQLVQGSGNARTDEIVLAMLHEIDHVDERPPGAMRFPIRISMNGHRP